MRDKRQALMTVIEMADDLYQDMIHDPDLGQYMDPDMMEDCRNSIEIVREMAQEMADAIN